MCVRFKEHHNKLKIPNSDNYQSSIEQHQRKTGHYFRESDITYLDSEPKKQHEALRKPSTPGPLTPPSTGEGASATTFLMTMTTHGGSKALLGLI
jgi:hypothetical protein